MTGYFASGTFDEVLKALERATGWLASLGVDVRAGRVGRYMDELRRLTAAISNKEFADVQQRLPEANTALYEAYELIQIHRGLGTGQFDTVLRDRLRRMSSGPTSYVDEDASSGNLPRNLAFELLIAERLATGGLRPAFSYDDVAVELEPRSVFIECKRLQSASRRALEKNFAAAERQFRAQYRRTANTQLRGLVAIDLTKPTNPGFVSPSMTRTEIGEVLLGYLKEFVDRNATLWRKAEKRTIGLLVRVSLLAACTDPKMMTHCQHYVLHPITNRQRLLPNAFDREALEILNVALHKAMVHDQLPLVHPN